MKRVMLLKENKLIYLLIYLLIYSCSTSQQKIKNNSNSYVSSNFINYNVEYNTLVDSIKTYLNAGLKEYRHIYREEWQIDSLICINSSKNKLVATINNSNGVGSDCQMDAITKVLGKKINDKWYFFEGGGTLAVPRDMYGKDAMHPLSFHELSQIARENCLASALIKDKAGNYIVNDDWVEKHFYNVGYGKYNSKAKYDSVHWHIILNKWKHKIDTNQYKPLRKNKNSEAVL